MVFLPNLNSDALYQAMIRGCQAVIAAREKLNAINLFPVADRDTGDNLAATANAVIQYAQPQASFDEMFQSVANASVLGARGNSGIIFSQFFNAFTCHSFEKETMSIADFSAILTNVAQFVRESIATPVEGTILSMMEAFARIIHSLSETTTCFNTLMATALPSLNDALESTKNQIAVLKKANVVDSGAAGFYFFVEGFASFHAKVAAPKVSEHALMTADIEHTHSSDTPPHHRYCTEAMLRSDLIDTSLLLPILEKKGDCLAFTGNQRVCKFHIHTNQPSDVFSALLDHGTIDYSKVDDMLRQFEVSSQPKRPIALVTDSGADIPQLVCDEHQLHLIPLSIHLGDHRLLDGYCFDPSTFYQEVASLKDYPKTSLPSPLIIEEKLSYLAQNYEQVLVISIAKGLSGTFDAMTQVAAKYDNIKVIDSGATSGAQGLMVTYAAELIQKGLPFDEVIQAVEAVICDTAVYVMVDSLDALMRSGRINKFTGRLGNMTGIKPILSLGENAKATIVGHAFGSSNALAKMIAMAQKQISGAQRELADYCIMHAGAEEKANEFAELTTKAFQMPPSFIKPVSAAIGLHAGFGAVGLALRMKDSDH